MQKTKEGMQSSGIRYAVDKCIERTVHLVLKDDAWFLAFTGPERAVPSTYLLFQICLVSGRCPREAVIIQRCLPTVQPAGAQRRGGDRWTGSVG